MLELTKPFEKILFDMDGTLVDSRIVVERVLRDWARDNNLNAEDILAVSHGRRTIDTVREFADSTMNAEAEAAMLEAREVTELDGVRAVGGARRLLAQLRPADWAVVTSASRELAVNRLSAARLPIPDVLVSADDVRHGKPDPEGYNLAAARLNSHAGRCLIFEDAPAGIAAGKAAGGEVVMVTEAMAFDYDPAFHAIENFNLISFYLGERLVAPEKN